MDEDIRYLRDQRLGGKKEDCFVYPLSSPEEYPASPSSDLFAVSSQASEERIRAFVGQRRNA